MKRRCDVCVIGSGFGGSLIALVLRKLGRDVILVDRGTHPRFAIGESLTPIGNRVLRDICRRYGLAEVEPLSKFGTWQRLLPQVMGGLKRGFSYFHHEAGRPFEADATHSTELLVAASDDDEHAETHWFRADVDRFLFERARDASVCFLDGCVLELKSRSPHWKLAGRRGNEEEEIEARFLIDATGDYGFLNRSVGLGDDTPLLQTHSRAVFGHFANAKRWESIAQARGANVADYPFHCDDAALHHVFDAGWMWQIRFLNDVVSIGFALDALENPVLPSVSPAQEFASQLKRFPSIDEQLREAIVVGPPDGIVQSRRLNRLVRCAAGPDFALLPSTAGFIDPLHSTGIAHTLCGIARLARLFEQSPDRLPDAAALEDYDRAVRDEIRFVDELVSVCYRTRRRFDLFVAATMLYFAAAITCERRRPEQSDAIPVDFLSSDHPVLRSAVGKARSLLIERCEDVRSERDDARAVFRIAELLNPFDSAGLFDPGRLNMHRATAAPKI